MVGARQPMRLLIEGFVIRSLHALRKCKRYPDPDKSYSIAANLSFQDRGDPDVTANAQARFGSNP
jgi:hypothetical protein